MKYFENEAGRTAPQASDLIKMRLGELMIKFKLQSVKPIQVEGNKLKIELTTQAGGVLKSKIEIKDDECGHETVITPTDTPQASLILDEYEREIKNVFA